MPPVLPLVLAALLVLAGLALAALAALGATGTLPRNRYAGVRTAASLRTADAFVLANRVAAGPLAAAAVVALAGGAVLPFAGGAAVWMLAALAGAGVVVLAGTGGALGSRAAERTLDAQRLGPAEAAPTCGGVCTGCDLVAGCRDATGTAPGGGAAQG